MNRILVDTNVLVSFVTNRDPAQFEKSRLLLEGAAAGGLEVLLHDSVLSELIFVLRNVYSVDAAECAQLLEEVVSLPGVIRIHGVPWSDLIQLWPARVRDFADAVLTAVARDVRPESIATFDKRFIRELGGLGIQVTW